MTIRTSNELKMFEKAIDNCRMSVLLVTPDGKQYDLKTPAGRYQGIARMLENGSRTEPELFTNCIEDEMTIFGFLMNQEAA